MVGIPTIITHAATPTSTSADVGAMVADAEAQQQDGGGVFVGGAADGGQRALARGGKRWPRQETMALLKIRSEMDGAFRDSCLKGPLWDEVCRKMVELGYYRNAKKCREKFENVFKYHRRTKEGKTYEFFHQLVALEDNVTPPSQSPVHLLPPPPPPHPPEAQMLAVHADPRATTPSNNGTAPQPSQHSHHNNNNNNQNYIASSSTSFYDDMERKRKEEYHYFMEVIMKSVIEKQHEFHKKIMETLEKNERERMIREEAWRNQEITERIKREYDLLAQERAKVETTHSTLLSLLENITHQQNPKNPSSETNNNTTQFQPPIPPPPPVMLPSSFADIHKNSHHLHQDGNDDGGESSMPTTSSSTWPKAEIEALIKIKTSLDSKVYQENGPKWPLWEEVSTQLKKLGYNKNSKRCKQKWENINKYFKKVKDNNTKKRSEASRTCSYFQQLDALYKEKAKGSDSSNNNTTSDDINYLNSANAVKPNSPMIPIMMSRMEEDLEMENVDYYEEVRA
ncbi:hypothetical protein Leryth_011430 [Lithospermum erythrorhizon]|nr:hypothetical protein Leryth_011430 [Lithospermum erythrorhizon]